MCEAKKIEDATPSETDIATNEDTEQTADSSTDQTQAQKANAGNTPIEVSLRYALCKAASCPSYCKPLVGVGVSIDWLMRCGQNHIFC